MGTHCAFERKQINTARRRAVLRALSQADDPLTLDDLVLLAMESETPLRRTLKDLRDKDIVRKETHPHDARRRVYRLIDDSNP